MNYMMATVPHRNDVMERVSTAEEAEFLKTEGSSF